MRVESRRSEVAVPREFIIEQPRIILLEEDYKGKRHAKVSIKEQLANLPTLNNVIVTDIPVSDMEDPEELRANNQEHRLLGYRDRKTGLINIDHHSDTPEMYRYVTATELACLYRMHNRDYSQSVRTVLTHTDADSVLAGAILAGILPPEQRFVDAANSADHTGEENEIADLLMAIAPKHDIAFSLSTLQAYLKGDRSLPEEVLALVRERKELRRKAKQLVEEGQVQDKGGGVFFAETTEDDLHPVLLRPYLPDAKVIVTENPEKNGKLKLVAGQQFPEGHSLRYETGLGDYGFHGRWGRIGDRPKPGAARLITTEEAISKVQEFLRHAQISDETFALLREYGISLEQWGKGEAKTFEQLVKEIEEGESVLTTDEGRLVRQVSPVGMQVFYEDKDGNKYKLIEDRQEFMDGRPPRRRNKTRDSVTEKMKAGEDVNTAFKRGLREELQGLTQEMGDEWVEDLEFVNQKEVFREKETIDYPGLLTKFHIHAADVTLPEKLYRPEGYVEKRDNMETYFVWEKVEPEEKSELQRAREFLAKNVYKDKKPVEKTEEPSEEITALFEGLEHEDRVPKEALNWAMEMMSSFLAALPREDMKLRKSFLEKVRHIRGVMDDTNEIALATGLDWNRTQANLIALLHDMGRLAQLAYYGTSSDKKSFNHAQASWALAVDAELPLSEYGCDSQTTLDAIKGHSADEYTGENMYTKLLTDADRLDVIKQTVEGRIGFLKRENKEKKVTGRILQDFIDGNAIHLVHHEAHYSPADYILEELSMTTKGFFFDATKKFVIDKGLVDALFEKLSENLPKDDVALVNLNKIKKNLDNWKESVKAKEVQGTDLEIGKQHKID